MIVTFIALVAGIIIPAVTLVPWYYYVMGAIIELFIWAFVGDALGY